MAKRKDVENFILKYIDKIFSKSSSKANRELYEEMFKKMSNEEFDRFMEDLRDGRKVLSVIVPNNDSRFKIDVDNNINIAKELGYNFFQRLKVGKTTNTPAYTTPNEYLVLKLPVRRAQQLLTKKISIPTDNIHVDMLSGQVTGKSKGSKLSNVEMKILIGLGLRDSVKELMKTRGGDLGCAAAMDGMLVKHGTATQQNLEQYSTGVVSKQTLKAYFNAMHIRNTL